ncbi:MAG: GTPase, partial [Bilifractor sp.]|nr:GTPase [Bilifractor sp.]
MSMNETPSSERVQIGFFGRRNAGKSSVINRLTGQSLSVVSDVPGTTTDPVRKAMEIHGLGPCVVIDTAGLDDVGELGALRVQKTKDMMDRIDLAVIVIGDGKI